MNNNQLMNLLTGLLFFMIAILLILCVVFIILKIKSNKKNKKDKNNNNNNNQKKDIKTEKTYSKESILDFMEFHKISDSMIEQKEGKRFLMVIECQGINFDLMSGLEKNSVEQGFIQFLNTLRYPIQIYVQTRTVNLTNSINTYKNRVDEISKQFAIKQAEFNRKLRTEQYSADELEKERYEIIRERNLYEYGIDIISNTEKMSLNKNILSKHYYIIIPYYFDEASNVNYTKDEISNIAFSELYTKSQALINSLNVCGIKSKVLDSNELVELLYVAYNRDESEIFNIRKALNAGYEDLYSTAQDVYEKRIKELDIEIEKDAIVKANEIVYSTIEENRKKQLAKKKEAEIDRLINEMAMKIIEDNKRIVGEEISEQAINKIEEEIKKEEGGKKDEKKTARKPRKSA